MPRMSHMINIKLGRALASLAAAATLTLSGSTASAADAPADRVLQPDRYTSDRGRALGQKHQGALRDLNAKIYHCMPWVEVQKQSIGFFKPKNATQDDRYLSVRIFVEQEPSPQFASLAVEERASSMFSRYVGPLLRRMAAYVPPAGDPSLDGFTVIASWLKAEPASGQPAVMETAAAFIPKPLVTDFLRGRAGVAQLAEGAHVIAWDGETKLGVIKPKAWADDFVLTLPTNLTGATFTGLLPSNFNLNSISQVQVEIYRVFPNDSDVGRTSGPPTFSTPQVPTRVNSPSDNAFDTRNSLSGGGLTVTQTLLNGTFTANNSITPGGIHPLLECRDRVHATRTDKEQERQYDEPY